MIKNYFKAAWRNLQRNKTYTVLNIGGLAVSIAACLLIFLVIRFETSFDNFHARKNSIYRIGSVQNSQDGVHYSEGVAFPVAGALRTDFPQLTEVASILKQDDSQVIVESTTSGSLQKFTSDVYYAEPGFFLMFDFEWLAGNAKSCLSQPNTAVLTLELAEKFFDDWRLAIGKTIKCNNNDREIYTITGILKNVPANTDFPLGVVLSYASLKNIYPTTQLEDWVTTMSNAYTFIVLPDHYPLAALNRDLRAFAQKHKPAEYAQDGYIAQALADIHYNDDFGNFNNHVFSKVLARSLSLIGFFLLIIACVNFINMATAQANNRSKEVGVRKALGSNRRQLTFQFLYETGLITLASLCIALVIAEITLPFLNHLLGLKISANFISDMPVISFLVFLFFIVTLLSGLYPGLVLSGFNPITVLRNKMTDKTASGISLRRGLVVLQFCIAHILIIGTLVVVSQMEYFRHTPLGFDTAAIINIPLKNDRVSLEKLDFLRNRLLQNPDITDVSFSFSSPSAHGGWSSDFKYDNAAQTTNFSANLKWADTDYFNVYGLALVAGRPYHPGDTTNEVVVNETLLKKLGVTNPADAIGKKIDLWDGTKVASIVGVIRDFNTYSLKKPMAPVIMGNWKGVYMTSNIKVAPGKEKEVLEYTETLWNEAFPDYVFQYSFLDETIRNFYRQEDQLAQLYKIFAAIAILISCLGLYGLVSFMAARRVKELGIRKVLGASANHIVYAFSKEFTLLVLVAFAIAAPVAYYFMHKWLQNFSYRITPGFFIFALSLMGSMMIAWLTVGYRAVKVAIANPVKSLRTE